MVYSYPDKPFWLSFSGEKAKTSSQCKELWYYDGKCQNRITRDSKNSAIFSDLFLAINFNHPFYDTIQILKKFYSPVFPNFMICGPEISANYSVVRIDQPKKEYGYYGYQCLVEAIRRNPGYNGYLYVNDDMIVNWWNLLQLDRNKVWFTSLGEVTTQNIYDKDYSFWWRRANCLQRCKSAYVEMQNSSIFTDLKIFQQLKKNLGTTDVCIGALSDIVYIPKRLSEKYALLGQKFYDHRLFLEVATPMAVTFLEDTNNVEFMEGVYLQKKYGWGRWTSNTDRAWNEYDFNTVFLHPYKFHGNNVTKNTKEFRDRVLWVSDVIAEDSCLDVLSLGRFWQNHTSC